MLEHSQDIAKEEFVEQVVMDQQRVFDAASKRASRQIVVIDCPFPDVVEVELARAFIESIFAADEAGDLRKMVRQPQLEPC